MSSLTPLSSTAAGQQEPTREGARVGAEVLIVGFKSPESSAGDLFSLIIMSRSVCNLYLSSFESRIWKTKQSTWNE